MRKAFSPLSLPHASEAPCGIGTWSCRCPSWSPQGMASLRPGTLSSALCPPPPSPALPHALCRFALILALGGCKGIAVCSEGLKWPCCNRRALKRNGIWLAAAPTHRKGYAAEAAGGWRSQPFSSSEPFSEAFSSDLLSEKSKMAGGNLPDLTKRERGCLPLVNCSGMLNSTFGVCMGEGGQDHLDGRLFRMGLRGQLAEGRPGPGERPPGEDLRRHCSGLGNGLEVEGNPPPPGAELWDDERQAEMKREAGWNDVAGAFRREGESQALSLCIRDGPLVACGWAWAHKGILDVHPPRP